MLIHIQKSKKPVPTKGEGTNNLNITHTTIKVHTVQHFKSVTSFSLGNSYFLFFYVKTEF